MMTRCTPQTTSTVRACNQGLLLKRTMERSWSCTVFMFFKRNCHVWAKLPISCFLCFGLSCFALLKPSPSFWVWGFQPMVLWFSRGETTLPLMAARNWKRTSQRVELHASYHVLFRGSLPHGKAVKTELAFFC